MDLDQIAAWLKEIEDEFVVIRDRLIAADDWLREELASSDANAFRQRNRKWTPLLLQAQRPRKIPKGTRALPQRPRKSSEEQGI